jgi:dolichyl-phosphate-mannose--protein O-mannosyl transferase
MVGKEIIAAAIWLLGDKPLSWRVPSALFGAIGLFAFGRLLWWASLRRFATIAGMILLFTSFAWFIQSRIAMLDMFMAGFGMVALWQFAAAMRLPAVKARWRLILCGLCLGLAIGAKWSFAPAAMVPGLTFLILRLRERRGRFLTASDAPPVPGITLVEAAVWLGALPLAVYWMTYAPAFFYAVRPIDPLGFLEQHKQMIALQDSVKKLHPYRSVWYQWVADWRAIWYLYEETDGAQRGVVLIGNPFSMYAGLPALGWCLWAGVRRQRYDALAMALLYLACIGMWIVSNKPIQFYYHYLLPGTFLMGCLALALDALWRWEDRWRWVGPGTLAIAAGIFIWFYPIISAAKLHDGRKSYLTWMWLHSWR